MARTGRATRAPAARLVAGEAAGREEGEAREALVLLLQEALPQARMEVEGIRREPSPWRRRREGEARGRGHAEEEEQGAARLGGASRRLPVVVAESSPKGIGRARSGPCCSLAARAGNERERARWGSGRGEAERG